MGARAAGPEDFDDAVARVRRQPLPALTAWALAPAPDLVEAHATFARWLVAGLLRIGGIWLGDDGTVAGGRRLHLRLSDRLRAPHPNHGELNVTANRGGFAYPDVPAACQRRLLDASAAGLRLRSSNRRTFLVQIWDATSDNSGTEPLDELVRHAQAIRHTCLAVASDPANTERLHRAGFTRGRDTPAGPDGRPALTAWEHPSS
jgi:hypothetical protein